MQQFRPSVPSYIKPSWDDSSEMRKRTLGMRMLHVMFRDVFWDILPCKMIVDRRFRGAYCLHHQGWWIPDDGGSTHLWNVGRQ
jgi:hypothetical protein